MMMFKPVPMTKVYVLGLKDQMEQTTSALAAAQVVHLEKAHKLPEFARCFTVARDEALQRKYRMLHEQYQACLEVLGVIPDVEIRVSDLMFHLDREAGQLQAMVSEILDACSLEVNRRKALVEEEKQLSHIRHVMEMMRDLDVDLAALKNLRFMEMTLGIVGHEKLGLLRLGLEQRFILVDRKVRAGDHLVMVVGDKEDQPLLEKVLTAAFFQPLVLPEKFLGRPADMIRAIRSQLQEIAAQKEDVTEALASIRSRYANALTTLGKKIRCAHLHFFARDHIRNSKETLILSGWLPKARMADIGRFIVSMNHGHELMVIEDDQSTSSQTPTLLRHAWLIRPFENILKIYGLPNYSELDPTAYLTLGFVLMFGMMFGDVGHGLLLGALGIWLRRGKLGRSIGMLRDTGLLLLACGASSAVFGFLYGSIFGFEKVFHPLWFNPFENLSYGLVVAIGWGVVFITGGAIINIVNRISNRQYIEAAFGRTGAAGVWFYLGAVAMMAGILMGVSSLKTLEAFIGLCLLPMLLVGLKEPLEAWHHAKMSRSDKDSPNTPHHKGPGQKEAAKKGGLEVFILSVMEVYDMLLGYLSNTLSFMRVAAFALNHVALMLAVFAVAQVIRNWTGSGVLYWAMFCIGNLGVIVLEGMIVTIQTLRLIYYEGFSKFYSGDGVAYQPFSLNTPIKS